MTGLASLLTRVFFRHVDIEGLDNLPRHGPAVVVANHTNGLVDALLLMTTLGRFPRFLGKATLFKIAPLRPFLRLAGAVPIYRPVDGAGTERNEDSFRTCRDLLARGTVIALFPEGVSHNEPALQPLRTGAARIALGSAADDGTAGVATVAVGLVYDARAKFRSRALVRVGPARPVEPWVDRYRRQPQATVREFTDDLADQLHRVVTTYRSWHEAAMLAAIAEIVAAPGSGSGAAGGDGDRAAGGAAGEESACSDPVTLAERERVATLLARVDLDATGLGRELGAAYRSYERELALLGLTDRQVSAHYGHRYRLAVGWSVIKIVVALPPGLIGVAVHAVPYQIMKKVATKPQNESIKATVKLLGCAASFTATYVGLAELARRKKGLAIAAIDVGGRTTERLRGVAPQRTNPCRRRPG